jgi:hypothetical protein
VRTTSEPAVLNAFTPQDIINHGFQEFEPTAPTEGREATGFGLDPEAELQSEQSRDSPYVSDDPNTLGPTGREGLDDPSQPGTAPAAPGMQATDPVSYTDVTGFPGTGFPGENVSGYAQSFDPFDVSTYVSDDPSQPDDTLGAEDGYGSDAEGGFDGEGADADGAGSGSDADGAGSGSDADGAGSGSDADGAGSGSDADGAGSGSDADGAGSGSDSDGDDDDDDGDDGDD